MITQSGVHIQKIGGADGTPTPMDIAVHSGRICRFGGCVWYPLLPHLVFVGLMAYRRTNNVYNLLWGFLHDAHEVSTSDVPQPFKCDCMRIEQNAIDTRLIKEYFGDSYFERIAFIDFKVIKQCDHDACDIEAVELGVPGFAEIEIRHTKDYRQRTAIHDDHDDLMLFQRIKSSVFFGDTIRGEESLGVQRFAKALSLAARKNYDEFLDEVLNWGLLG